MTVGATIAQVARDVRKVSDAPALEAARIVEHVLGRHRGWLIAHAGDALDGPAQASVAALVERRRTGEPLAYVLGTAWFFGRAFIVDEHVLVPRPESEQLVEAALDELRARAMRSKGGQRACDVGTGCGALGVTLAAELSTLEVIVSDASEAALAIAAGNAMRLGVGDRVQCVGGDLAKPLLALGPYDCVVANLPYVPTGDIPAVPNPVGFEPRLALDGGSDGLGLYRRLIPDLPALLAPGASAFLEAAPGTIEGLAALATALPHAHVEVGEDYAGQERWLAITL